MREDAAAANNPFLWREASAARSACRNSDSVHHDAALQQILDHAGETLLLGPIAVRARFQKDCDDDDDDGDDNGNAMIEGNNESGSENNLGTTSAAWVSGKVVISSKHLYFWWVSMRAEDQDDGPAAAYSSLPGNREDMNTSINNNDLDLRIRAHRINLHALLAEDDDEAIAANGGGTGAPSAVYLQICTSADEAWHGQEDDDSNNPDDDSGSEEQLFELTLQPVLASSATTGTAAFPDDSIQQTCQQLFDAISRMVELNPIDPNMDETGDEDGVFGGGGSWITSEHADLDGASIMAMMGAGPESGGDASDDDDLICCPKVNTSTAPEEVTEDERDAMLERLDNLLIVPPEYEIHEGDVSDDEGKGQFDDADEDDEIL